MKALGGLVRIHRWHVDEKRREHAVLLLRREGLTEEQMALAGELAQEQAIGAGADTGPADFRRHADAVFSRQERLTAALSELEAEIDSSLDRLAEAYQDAKKFENMESRARRRLRVEQERREQADLDEIAIDRHRRRDAGG